MCMHMALLASGDVVLWRRLVRPPHQSGQRPSHAKRLAFLAFGAPPLELIGSQGEIPAWLGEFCRNLAPESSISSQN